VAAQHVVYGVAIIDDHVWVATAAGAGALNMKTGVWKIYDHNNSHARAVVLFGQRRQRCRAIGVWAWHCRTRPGPRHFKETRSDGDFHYDLLSDDGPLTISRPGSPGTHGIMWQCNLFGMSRYDGKFWKTWVQDKSPLPSNFTQFAWPVPRLLDRPRSGCVPDRASTGVNYLVGDKGEGLVEIHRAGNPSEKRPCPRVLNTFVLGIWADENEACSQHPTA